MEELLTGWSWAAFGLGILVATQPVWSHFLSNNVFSRDDQLSIRCSSSDGLKTLGQTGDVRRMLIQPRWATKFK
ncbi:hypothetical protein FHX15_005991 [Rhizobium sp. BK650]|uniref:hypothetical protein n=1 Tax=Rhizobium sp. BK650 TaxID=2586990 RepID=UPI00161A2853|nr:hypothetical protein [Rhizobium sp. BK650]MBB3660720.1 hypothetical protein [Rhizobium sp. BK650]